MRQGELVGLKWRDIDFKGKFIEVRRGVTHGIETTTKSHKIRRVDMTASLIETLQGLYESRSREAAIQRVAMPEYVFLTPSWTRWDDSNLRRIFAGLLTKAGIRRVRFHDLRHTYASLMAQAGAPPKYVQEQLGHSSIQVTMDIYSHLFPGGGQQYVQRLGEALHMPNAPAMHPATSVADARRHTLIGEVFDMKWENVELARGIEPPTCGLQNRCSAD